VNKSLYQIREEIARRRKILDEPYSGVFTLAGALPVSLSQLPCIKLKVAGAPKGTGRGYENECLWRQSVSNQKLPITVGLIAASRVN
jgi:hypothetical protein